MFCTNEISSKLPLYEALEIETDNIGCGVTAIQNCLFAGVHCVCLALFNWESLVTQSTEVNHKFISLRPIKKA